MTYFVLTENDTNLREILNGKYEIIYFSSNNILNTDILFFKFNEGKIKINLNGNNNFLSNGFLYNNNNITNLFQYIPNENDKQIITIDRLKTIDLLFYDKNNTIINLTDYTFILKKI